MKSTALKESEETEGVETKKKKGPRRIRVAEAPGDPQVIRGLRESARRARRTGQAPPGEGEADEEGGEGGMEEPSSRRPRRIRRARARRWWSMDRSGVSSVLSSLLVFGVVLGFIIGMAMTYQPMVTKNREAAHTEGVVSAFLDIKETFDTLQLRGQSDVTMYCNVQLGVEGGPVFGLGKTQGGLSFDPAVSGSSIYATDDVGDIYCKGRGQIEYYTNNNQYPDHNFYYEGGGVLMVQEEDLSMAKVKAGPNMVVAPNSNGTGLKVHYASIAMGGSRDHMSGMGEATMSIRLDYAVPSEYTFINGQNMTLEYTTAMPSLWYDFFNMSFTDDGLTWDSDGSGAGASGDYYMESAADNIKIRLACVYELTVNEGVFTVAMT